MSSVENIIWKASSIYKQNPPQFVDSSLQSYCDSLTPFDDETILRFVKDISCKKGISAAATILFPSDVRRNSKIKDQVFLASMFSESNRQKNHSELVEMGKSVSLNISNDELEEIARLTKGKSKYGIALKRGRINESSLKDCCKTDIANPSITSLTDS